MLSFTVNNIVHDGECMKQTTCEQAFELSDASAERSAAGCTIKLKEESVVEYLNSNIRSAYNVGGLDRELQDVYNANVP